MKKIIILFLVLLLAQTIEALDFMGERTIYLGDIPYIIQNKSFAQLGFLKQTHLIDSSAFNIKVFDYDGKELNFTRYSYENSNGLKSYFKTACSPDEEGYLFYDGSWTYTTNEYELTFKGGACEKYDIPTKEFDVLLINKSGLSIPFQFYTVHYELRKKFSNGICVREADAFNTRFVLYDKAYVWNYTGSATVTKNEENREIISILLPQIYGKVCFSYGTAEELENLRDKKNSVLTWFAFLAVLFLSTFWFILSHNYNKNKEYYLLYLGGASTLIILSFLFFYQYYVKIFPPVLNEYRFMLKILILIIFLIFFISIIGFRWPYNKCDYCKGIYKNIMKHKENCTKSIN